MMTSYVNSTSGQGYAAALPEAMVKSAVVHSAAPVASDAKTASAPVSTEQVKQAAAAINTAIQSLSRGLQFSVDEDTHKTVVRVVDTQTNEVIRQMPSEEALAIAKALDKLQGLLLRQKA